MFGLKNSLLTIILMCLFMEVISKMSVEVAYSILDRRIQNLEIDSFELRKGMENMNDRMESLELLIKSQMTRQKPKQVNNAEETDDLIGAASTAELKNTKNMKKMIMKAFNSEKLLIRKTVQKCEKQFVDLKQTVADQIRQINESTAKNNYFETALQKTETFINNPLQQSELTTELKLQGIVADLNNVEKVMKETDTKLESVISNQNDLQTLTRTIDNNFYTQSNRIQSLERSYTVYTTQATHRNDVDSIRSSVKSLEARHDSEMNALQNRVTTLEGNNKQSRRNLDAYPMIDGRARDVPTRSGWGSNKKPSRNFEDNEWIDVRATVAPVTSSWDYLFRLPEVPKPDFSWARKVVDYGKLGLGDDDDDDFADSTPPVAKRPKLSNKENKDRKKEKQKKESKAKSRQSVEERLYERELQEALQLSLSQSDGSQDSTSTPIDTSTSAGPPPLVLIKDSDDDRAPSPILPQLDSAPVLMKMVDKTDEIVILESNVDVIPSSRNQRKAKKYIDSDSESGDSDFNPADANDDDDDDDDDDDNDDDDGSDDDYNGEDSDSDFGPSKKKKNPKKLAAKTKQPAKKATPASKTVNPKTANTQVTSKPSAVKPKPSPAIKTSTVNKSSPVTPTCRTPTSSLVARKPPNWKPPGAAGDSQSPVVSLNKSRPSLGGSSGGIKMSPLGGVNIKSPSSGIRIGLSRNMKLKPLHPNLKPHT